MINYKKIVNDFWAFIFRRKTFEAVLLRTGLTIITVILSIRFAPTLLVNLSDSFSVFDSVSYGRQAMSAFVFYLLLTLGIVIILFSIYLGYKNNRKTPELNLVFTQFSLFSELEGKLKDAIEKSFLGVCQVTNSNIKPYFDNGECTNPEQALKKIEISIQAFINSFESQSIAPKVIYGGMISTPFSFYTGMEMDDKYHIDVYDFNRESKSWDQVSDNILKQPQEIILKDAGDAEDIVLIVNTSYPVRIDDVQDAFPNFPIAQLTVANINVNNHWDLDFQNEFQSEFFKYVQQLSIRKTKTIHLILVAQNSIAFNLGRCYDNRNLPSLIVYQYESSNHNCKYPWGVKVKTHGLANAEIIVNRVITQKIAANEL